MKDLDMSIIGETEILAAAGIEADGTLYEEIESNEFLARLFWYLIQKQSRVFVLGETQDEWKAWTSTSRRHIPDFRWRAARSWRVWTRQG